VSPTKGKKKTSGDLEGSPLLQTETLRAISFFTVGGAVSFPHQGREQRWGWGRQKKKEKKKKLRRQ